MADAVRMRSEEIGKIVRATLEERDGKRFVVIEADMIGAGAVKLLKELEEHGLTLFFECEPLLPAAAEPQKPGSWHHASERRSLPSYPTLVLHWFHDNGCMIFQGRVDGKFRYVLEFPNGLTEEFDALKHAKAGATFVEVQVCQRCRTKAFIQVRSIDDTFWCCICKAWVACDPPAAWKAGGGSLSEGQVQ